MKIYGDKRSGNCYKLQLTASLLSLDYEWVDVDIMRGESHTPSFLAMSSTGKIPLLALDDGRYLSESNAIINFLAVNSEYLPSDPFTLAKLQQWQFFEQYSHEPFIAVARFIKLYQGLPESRQAEFSNKLIGGYKALDVMEQQLQSSPWLTGEKMTTADISLYAYTHVAHEGGFDLDDYPAIRAWLLRIESRPGYCPMG